MAGAFPAQPGRDLTNNAGGGSTGGGLGAVSLVDLGTVAGGAPLSLVASPGYAAP